MKKGIIGSVLSFIALPISAFILFYTSLAFALAFAASNPLISDLYAILGIWGNIAVCAISVVLNIIALVIYRKLDTFKKFRWIVIVLLILQFIICAELIVFLFMVEEISLGFFGMLALAVALIIANILIILNYKKLCGKLASIEQKELNKSFEAVSKEDAE